jgi:hypothetical protein
MPRHFGYGPHPHRGVISHVCLVFLLEGLTLTLSPDTWMVHVSCCGSRPTGPSGEVLKTVKTSSGRTEPSTSSCPT